MRLDYKILWFEDNEGARDHFEDDLKTHLEMRGYELTIKWLKKYPLNAPVKFESYDLIVTDLNLLGSGDGAGLVAQIRQDRILTKILLYSGLPGKFKQAVAKLGGLDRVSYHNGRNEGLQKKLRDIVDSTIKKVEGVRNMRGLVIAEAIELEGKLRRILVEVMAMKSGNPTRTNLEQTVKSYLAHKTGFFQKKAASVEKLSVSLEMLKDEQMMTAYDCFVLGCSVLKAISAGKEPGLSHHNRLNNFNRDVIDLRNTLAHVAEEIDEKGQTVIRSRRKDGKELVLDATTCTKIRKSLREYRALFSDLPAFLGVKID